MYFMMLLYCSVAKSCLSLCNPMNWLEQARLLCPPFYPGVCSNSCPLSQWCCLTISSSAALFSFYLLSFSQHQGVFQWIGSLHQAAKVLELQQWSFQWIFRVDSFRVDWFDLLAIQGTLKSLLQYHNLKVLILQLSLYDPTLTSVHDY